MPFIIVGDPWIKARRIVALI